MPDDAIRKYSISKCTIQEKLNYADFLKSNTLEKYKVGMRHVSWKYEKHDEVFTKYCLSAKHCAVQPEN